MPSLVHISSSVRQDQTRRSANARDRHRRRRRCEREFSISVHRTLRARARAREGRSVLKVLWAITISLSLSRGFSSRKVSHANQWRPTCARDVMPRLTDKNCPKTIIMKFHQRLLVSSLDNISVSKERVLTRGIRYLLSELLFIVRAEE